MAKEVPKISVSLRDLTPEHIESVYSGIDGRCCCGCSGTHYYNPTFAKAASKRQGYEVQTSTRMVPKALRMLMEQPVSNISGDSTFVSFVIGERLYCLYAQPGVEFQV